MSDTAFEPHLLRLSFLGSPMAVLAYRAADSAYALELDPAFLAAGHELSPLHLPLATFASGPRVFRPVDTPFPGGLPGLIADSLPDAWGDQMLRNEVPELRTVLGKLAAIGQRGPGAITYEPVVGHGADRDPITANLTALVHDAANASAAPAPLSSAQVSRALARGGSALGGTFPKIAVHLPLWGDFLERREVLIGGPTPRGHVPCILKFSPLNDEGGGSIEFAFHRMAKNAGIRVPRACLVHDGERRHFACERFDRYRRLGGATARRHVHTLSRLIHRRATDCSIDYEEFMRLTRRLAGAEEAAECFRRAVFNLLSTNRDDHGRNHAFLYDETGRSWSLAPAYDMNPHVANHLVGLSWLGSTQIPTRFESLTTLAEIGGIPVKTARAIYDQVEAATLGGWRQAATYAGVPAGIITAWEQIMEQQTQLLRADAARLALSKGALAQPAQKSRPPKASID